MIFVVDIETSGIDPKINGILSLGAVLYDDPEKKFYEECRVRDGAIVAEEALNINGFSREEIADPRKQNEENLIRKFIGWCNGFPGPKMIAGHIVDFDLGFISELCDRYGIKRIFGKRVLDQHSICFGHIMSRNIDFPMREDKYNIDSDFVMDYVGIGHEPKPHKAINGAIWETEALLRLLEGKGKIKDFQNLPIPEYLKIS